MDPNSPQAYGIGRASGHVDIQQFFQSTSVIYRVGCLAFSFIVYMSISATTQWADEYHKEVCLYDIEKESVCYVGMQVALLGIIEGFILIGLEYMLWKSSSIKLRRRAVRAVMAISASQSLICGITFLYIMLSYMKAKSLEGTSRANPFFGLLFLLLSFTIWCYLAMEEYKRFLKGVDPEFSGAGFAEDAAHYTTYNANDNIENQANMPLEQDQK